VNAKNKKLMILLPVGLVAPEPKPNVGVEEAAEFENKEVGFVVLAPPNS
jgi:hypothetical protein